MPDTSSGDIMFGGKNPSKELMDMCFIGVLLLSGYFLLGGSNSTLTLWLSLFFFNFLPFCCGRNGQAKWKSVLCHLCTSELHQRIRSFRREKASSVL